MTNATLTPELRRLTEARHHDPFAVLGKHVIDNHIEIRAYIPDAAEVTVADGELPMERISTSLSR